MVLTQKQKDELHQAILQYFLSIELTESAEVFKAEASVKDIDQLDKNLLESKWTSIVRLSKKVMSLEQQIESLNSELEQLRKNPFKTYNSEIQQLPIVPQNEKFTLRGHRGGVNSISFHPSYSQIASASDDGTIKLWDSETGRFEQTLSGHTSHINDVKYDPSGKLLASASSDLSVKIWDLKNYQCFKTLLGHEHTVSAVEFSSHGDFLISVSRDKVMKLWESATGFCKRTFTGHSEWIRCCAYSPDDKQIATGSQDQTIIIWSTEKGETLYQLYGHDHIVEQVKFLPLETVKKILDKSTNKSKSQENGKLIAFSQIRAVIIEYLAAADFVIKGPRYSCLFTLSGHDNWVNGIALHLDGVHLYSVSDDKTIRVWNIVEQKLVKKLSEAHDRFILKVALSQQQLVLATCSIDQTIKIWALS